MGTASQAADFGELALALFGPSEGRDFMTESTTNRKPTERRGGSHEYGKARERRADDRRDDDRRTSGDDHTPERRSGDDRRQEDQRDIVRRSGDDRRTVPERLNRVSAILLPRLLGPREDEEAVFESDSSVSEDM